MTATTKNAPARSGNSGEGCDDPNPLSKQEETSMPTLPTDARTQRPAWADPALDERHDDGHPDDHCTTYKSPPIDEWTPDLEGEHATVFISGAHYANGEDHTDTVVFKGGTLGAWLTGQVSAVDARRLGEALIKGADLIEAATPTPTGHTLWCADADHDPALTHCCSEGLDLGSAQGYAYLTTRDDRMADEVTIEIEATGPLTIDEAKAAAATLLALVKRHESPAGHEPWCREHLEDCGWDECTSAAVKVTPYMSAWLKRDRAANTPAILVVDMPKESGELSLTDARAKVDDLSKLLAKAGA